MMEKVNIIEVYNAVCLFQTQSRHAGIDVKLHDKAREDLKAKFEAWGLADRIDWADKERG